jgi:methylated-DNA-[protein]-cysteine S-methyltransferase
MKSPVGELKIVASKSCLVAILWDNERPSRVKLNDMTLNNAHSLILEAEKQLREYFDLRRTRFDLPLHTQGTAFQQSVWKLLIEIPYGKTESYKNIAEKMNNPKAVQAVGSANGRNPIPIIVPCHRVIANNGNLSGFAGGISRKKFLLDLEKKQGLDLF